MSTPSIFEIHQNKETIFTKSDVKKEMKEYDSLFENDENSVKRKENYMTMVNNFYDLVTDFYEYGWGESFHFACRFKGEGFQQSLARSEHFLALRLELKEGKKVLDIGCGVGGPARSMARFSGASITGLNNNAYQIKRATLQTKEAGLSKTVDYLQADFMNIPVADNTYDASYAIESTCHSPDKTKTFKEILRVLKPGGYLAGYEWCMTSKYDPSNEEHKKIKFGIEVGNGLPDIVREEVVVNCLKEAGFEVIEAFDSNKGAHDCNEIPWYMSLAGEYFSLGGFRHTPVGMTLTHAMVTVLEKVGVAPEGTVRVHDMLHKTAVDLVKAGQLGIFTPDYYFLARKPLADSNSE